MDKVTVIQILPDAVFRVLLQDAEISLGAQAKGPLGLQQPGLPELPASYLWQRLGQETDGFGKTFRLPLASEIFPLARYEQSKFLSTYSRKNGVVRNLKGQFCSAREFDIRANALGKLLMLLQGRQRHFKAA